jgi:hypothetical protein
LVRDSTLKTSFTCFPSLCVEGVRPMETFDSVSQRVLPFSECPRIRDPEVNDDAIAINNKTKLLILDFSCEAYLCFRD